MNSLQFRTQNRSQLEFQQLMFSTSNLYKHNKHTFVISKIQIFFGILSVHCTPKQILMVFSPAKNKLYKKIFTQSLVLAAKKFYASRSLNFKPLKSTALNFRATCFVQISNAHIFCKSHSLLFN